MSNLLRISLFTFALFAIPGISAAATTVAVDIGHSAASPGATSARGRAEFYFNRDLAGHLAAALQTQQFNVRLVNWDGSHTGLESRTAQARQVDFFISVHHDSVQPRYLKTWVLKDHQESYSDWFSGFSLFVSRWNPNPARSLACASAIGAALRESGFTPTLHHAEPIEGENRTLADEANGVYYYDELTVLRTAMQPAILLEAGVIANRDEETMLARIDTQQRIGRAVTRGLIQCLRPGGKPLEKTQQSHLD